MNICLMLISDGWGGAENVVYEILKNLANKENSVFLITNHEIVDFYKDLNYVKILDIGYVYDWKWLISKTLSLQRTEKCISGSKYICEFLRPFYFIKIRSMVFKFLIDNSIDIIHSHLENSDMLAYFIKKPNIPIITTIHGRHVPSLTSEMSFSRLPTSFKILILRAALKRMDFITAVSTWQLERINQYVHTECKNKVVCNGIDLKDLMRYSEETMPLKGDFKILFPGGDKIWKGIDIVIQAIEIAKTKIPGIHLYVSRAQSQKGYARKMVQSLGLEDNATIYGLLPREQYYKLMNSVDLLCMPSKEEAFGIVFLEAMALGKPIVASNLGGIPGFIQNGKNGILVNPTADMVAKAILAFYENSRLRNEIAENNKIYVKNFDWKEIVGEYLTIYGKIIASHEN